MAYPLKTLLLKFLMNNKTLKQIYQDHRGKVSDKWSLYLSEYDRVFFEFQEREICILEIGIQNGGSLEIWARYFSNAKKIVGCDINADCYRLTYEDPRVAVVVGDANLAGTEKIVLSHAQSYDLIIDDGSHRSSDIVKSFARYFKHLADGGLFVVEDLHCSYWREFEGGLYDPFSSIGFFKQLADVLNHEHWGLARTRTELLADFASHYETSFDEEVLAHIHSIEFINSVCVIRKQMPEGNESGRRIISGEEELVVKNVKVFNDSKEVPLDQSHNIWSVPVLSLEGDWEQRLKALGESDRRIAEFEEEISERGRKIEEFEERVSQRDKQIEEFEERLTERDKQRAEFEEKISECDRKISELEEKISECDRQNEQYKERLHNLEQALIERDVRMANLEEQESIRSAELFRLTAESARFGSRIGRKITQLRAHIAPVGTVRGTLVTLFSKFVFKLFSQGLRSVVSTTYRYVSYRLRSKLSQINIFQKRYFRVGSADENPIISANDEVTATTDHPQFSAWIASHEPNSEQLAAQKSDADKFSYKPLLSVVIPIYKVPRDVLSETLDCLVAQSYSNWQACVVWSDSEDLAGWAWLQNSTRSDKRFKIKYLDENGGISRNSNAALELVDGEYVALLDHDDTLTPWAFYEVVKLLQSSPQLDFIYSDKDSVTADGRIRLNALFKPEWSPEMLHSVNYLTHLNIMRTRLVREIGGWDPATDGAQDWDIFLRIAEKTRHVARISSIHYHWRILSTSTATGLKAKPYAALAQLRTQQNFFKRKKLMAAVMPTPEGLFHVKWPAKPASTDVIVYQTGSLKQLINVVNQLRRSSQDMIRQVYVVHNTAPNEALQKSRKRWGDHYVVVRSNSTDWHTALKLIKVNDESQAVLLLDGRISILSEGLVEELAGWVVHHPDIGWTSAIALNSSGTVYEAGRVVAKNYQSAPMFHGSPIFSFGWLGGPVWYRNARAASPYAFAMNARDMEEALSELEKNECQTNSFTKFCLALTAGGHRGLINPFAKVYFSQPPELNWPNDGRLYHEDPYFSPVFDQVSPLRLQS